MLVHAGHHARREKQKSAELSPWRLDRSWVRDREMSWDIIGWVWVRDI
jgi:hypothetical protein